MSEDLCTLHTEVLALSTVNQLSADLLEGLDVYSIVNTCCGYSACPSHTARSEGDADTVDLWPLAEVLLALVVAHFELCVCVVVPVPTRVAVT